MFGGVYAIFKMIIFFFSFSFAKFSNWPNLFYRNARKLTQRKTLKKKYSQSPIPYIEVFHHHHHHQQWIDVEIIIFFSFLLILFDLTLWLRTRATKWLFVETNKMLFVQTYSPIFVVKTENEEQKKNETKWTLGVKYYRNTVHSAYRVCLCFENIPKTHIK